MLMTCSFVIQALTSRILSGYPNGLYSVHDWTLKRGFIFSPAKAVAMCFHLKRTILPLAYLFIVGRQIPARECIKYLGMLLGRRLTYSEGITYIKRDFMKRQTRPSEMGIKHFFWALAVL